MATGVNRQILLKSRPEGAPNLDNFELVRSPVPEPGDGEVLMRTRYLSLDPYMRGRMSAAKSYAKPVEVGEPMVGGTVSEIVKSRCPTAPACASSIRQWRRFRLRSVSSACRA
jgi:NADPH-dependent curcumin reductase CurA